MPEAPTTANESIAALRAAYHSGLPQKLESIEFAASVLKPDTPADQACAALGELHGLLHKLAGSAGLYGLRNLSRVARLMEVSCLDLLEKGTAVSAHESKELGLLIELLHNAATPGAWAAPVSSPPEPNSPAEQALPGESIIPIEDDRAPTAARPSRARSSNWSTR